MPGEEELLSRLQECIVDCAQLFATPPVTELKAKLVVKKGKNTDDNAAEDGDA